MDKETVRYIRRYYSRLLIQREREAMSHELFSDKIAAYGEELWHKHYVEGGFINKDNALGLLVEDFDALEHAFAERTLALHPDRVFMNYCHKCTRLARTPQAKQCRYCGYSWHHLMVTVLKFDSIFSVANRGPVLIAEFLNDKAIKIGQFADLTTMGRNRQVEIKGIETVTRYDGKIPKGLPALLLPDLSEEDAEWLRRTNPKGRYFEILKEGWL